MSRRSELQAKMEVEQSKQVAWIAKANKATPAQAEAYAAGYEAGYRALLALIFDEADKKIIHKMARAAKAEETRIRKRIGELV